MNLQNIFQHSLNIFIKDRTGSFHSVVEGQDPRAIAAAREQFSAALDDIEGKSLV